MIDILLSVYNGEKFLKEQIDSILSQSCTDWHLYIRDDGSRDSSVNIIKQYSQDFCSKIFFLDDYLGNIGILQSYNVLADYVIRNSSSQYFMFSDQDDVWHKDKIMLTYIKMKSIENKGVPCLVHTDLVVCDAKLNTISPTMWRYQKLNPKICSFTNYLVQNNVTGCTILVNRNLLVKAFPIPKMAIMHDWWMAMVAAGFGVIDYEEKPLIYYRQHSSNTLGAKSYSLRHFFEKIFVDKLLFKSIYQKITQSQQFLNIMGSDLDKRFLLPLEAFSQILCKNKIKRVYILWKNNIFMQDKMKNIGLVLTIFLTKKSKTNNLN